MKIYNWDKGVRFFSVPINILKPIDIAKLEKTHFHHFPKNDGIIRLLCPGSASCIAYGSDKTITRGKDVYYVPVNMWDKGISTQVDILLTAGQIHFMSKYRLGLGKKNINANISIILFAMEEQDGQKHIIYIDTSKLQLDANSHRREWYNSSYKLHRKDGPAIEHYNGSKEWYFNGKLHRKDGPAIDRYNGAEMWYFNGKLHREGGPAVKSPKGWEEYWRHGNLIKTIKPGKKKPKENKNEPQTTT